MEDIIKNRLKSRHGYFLNPRSLKKCPVAHGYIFTHAQTIQCSKKWSDSMDICKTYFFVEKRQHGITFSDLQPLIYYVGCITTRVYSLMRTLWTFDVFNVHAEWGSPIHERLIGCLSSSFIYNTSLIFFLFQFLFKDMTINIGHHL